MSELRPHPDYSKSFAARKANLPQPEKTGRAPHELFSRVLEIRSTDCSDLDLSQYDGQFIDFDDKTVFPSDPAKMPKDFNPSKIMERGKDSGLGIRALHERGLTGKGIAVAIIDQRLSPHQEYNNNLVHYEEFGYENVPNPYGNMHGAAVASLLVGKTCGAAPDAKLYYFAANHLVYDSNNNIVHNDETGRAKATATHYAKALERILEINKTLEPKDRIQVVSVSWGAQSIPGTEDHEKWNTLVQKAAAQGVFVCSCSPDDKEVYQAFFFGIPRKVNGNPNNPIDYIIPQNTNIQNYLLFPRDQRTVASPQGEDMYVHYANGGDSWRTPCSAGLFALARQINPKITPEQFYKLGKRTGVQTPYGTLILPERLFGELQNNKTNIYMSMLERENEDRQH